MGQAYTADSLEIKKREITESLSTLNERELGIILCFVKALTGKA